MSCSIASFDTVQSCINVRSAAGGVSTIFDATQIGQVRSSLVNLVVSNIGANPAVVTIFTEVNGVSTFTTQTIVPGQTILIPLNNVVLITVTGNGLPISVNTSIQQSFCGLCNDTGVVVNTAVIPAIPVPTIFSEIVGAPAPGATSATLYLVGAGGQGGSSTSLTTGAGGGGSGAVATAQFALDGVPAYVANLINGTITVQVLIDGVPRGTFVAQTGSPAPDVGTTGTSGPGGAGAPTATYVPSPTNPLTLFSLRLLPGRVGDTGSTGATGNLGAGGDGAAAAYVQPTTPGGPVGPTSTGGAGGVITLDGICANGGGGVSGGGGGGSSRSFGPGLSCTGGPGGNPVAFVGYSVPT